MNFMNLFTVCLITIGGFIAATYEVIAIKSGLPVGNYFRSNGILAIIGGFVTFGAVILSAFINPWWTIFIVFIIGWFFSQLAVRIFKTLSQVISLVLILIGITLFIATLF